MARPDPNSENPSTYEYDRHNMVSHIPELLKQYYVVRGLSVNDPVEYITSEYYWKHLDAEERSHYTTMTQAQLARLAGIRKNAVTDLIDLSRKTVNLPQLTAIMNALGITDISKLISYRQD